jgi:hypothetical protein
MSIFSKILDKLGLGKKKEEEDAEQAKVLKEMARKEAEARAKMAKDAAARAPGAPVPTPVGSVPKATGAPARTTAPGTAQPAAPQPMSKVDVVTKLENLAQGSGLNWKNSIADLLALLKIDHSREARIELAKELGCPPEYITGDLSKMNTWLHKTVLQKIADNGGNIPQELLD